MTAWVLALGLGCLAGAATGGRLSQVLRIRLRGWALVGAAVAAQAGAGLVAGPARTALVVGACVSLGCWCALNGNDRRLVPGLVALSVGLAANAVVMALNAGMPVNRHALAAAGLPAGMNVAGGHLYKHVAMTGRTHLGGLGDFIPVRVLHMVASPGDMLMLAGIALLAWGATLAGGGSRLLRVTPEESH